MMIVINAAGQAQLVQPFVFANQIIIAPAFGRAKSFVFLSRGLSPLEPLFAPPCTHLGTKN